MSTDYVTDQPINMVALYNFNHQGVKVDSIDEESVLLTDGTNYLHAEKGNEIYTVKIDHTAKQAELEYSHDYHGIMFSRYGRNDPEKIIAALENYFKVRVISEHEDEFDEIVG